MKKFIVAVALCATPALALAQQQPDPAFLQRALNAMAGQRNAAQDEAAGLRAQLDLTSDKLAKAEAEIKELKAKKDAAPPADQKH